MRFKVPVFMELFPSGIRETNSQGQVDMRTIRALKEFMFMIVKE